jgi:hypothetical protein
MATWQHKLADPPTDPRARELWLQHAAGFIIFEDVRRYARERIDQGLSAEARAAVEKGIDDAVYGLMQVIDGVTGGLSSESHNVSIEFIVRLAARDQSGNRAVLSEVDLGNGDGVCMGYHGWREGDFGKSPVVAASGDRQQTP